MKKVILTMIMVVVALWAAASERLYIENFSIEPGETKQVSIILENETQYTAFQADIYLPEGLTVEKEDDEYAFELTSRKSRDHIIMGQDRPDGAIRVMSYSMQVNPFSGNSGELVTFNVTASEDFYDEAVIELKHTLFTTLNDQEVSFANESCQVQPILKDLTGEIQITEEGYRNTVYSNDYGVIDLYRYLRITYTGEEDVVFSILFNGINILEDDDYCYSVSSENQNSYLIDLFTIYEYYTRGIGETWPDYDYWKMSWCFKFDIAISSPGYKDLSTYHEAYFVDVFPEAPSIGEAELTDLSLAVMVGYGTTNDQYCSLDDAYIYERGSEYSLYVLKRLDYDYSITVYAHNKLMMGDVYAFCTDTIYVPARKCSISIYHFSGNEEELRPTFLIIDRFDPLYPFNTIFSEVTDHVGNNYAIINYGEDDGDDYNGSLHISVNGQPALNEFSFPNGYESYAINLLPFSDSYGGDYYIQAIITDSYNSSLSADTVLEYHPIETRLSSDSLIIDVNPGIRNAILLVNGEEVELSPDEQGQAHLYPLERQDEDYSIIVQVGNKITDSHFYEEGLQILSQETTIDVPARLYGDLNGDRILDVSDVTTLIAFVLGNSNSSYNKNADLDHDGIIDVADITMLISQILNN